MSIKFFRELTIDDSLKNALIEAKSKAEQEDALCEVVKFVAVELDDHVLECDFHKEAHLKNDLGIQSLEALTMGDIIERNFDFHHAIKDFPYNNMTVSKYVEVTLVSMHNANIVNKY